MIPRYPRGMRGAFVSAALLLVVACDSRAKASDPARPEQKSKEYESCGATMHCDGDLRCFDSMCRRTARSTVGDYYAALGASLRGKGEIEGAIDSYNRALGHYDSEKIALPPDVDCAYGAALAAGKAKKDHAELGARVLHRCILAVPSASLLRDHALADLATLNDAGLDPLTLGRTSLADVYLTRAASGPSTDKLTVTVTATPVPAGKTYQGIPELIGGAEIKNALVACWTTYNAASKKDAMTVSMPIKSGYIPSEYEDEAGVYTMKIDPTAGLAAGSPDAAADQCVRSVIEPAIKDLKTIRDAFATKLTITVK
ncbi:MAG: hypothetical protein JWO36_3096 [Myxococcales bacterium]|nr:hypothetical protein [Myxococcales bacterium]